MNNLYSININLTKVNILLIFLNFYSRIADFAQKITTTHKLTICNKSTKINVLT